MGSWKEENLQARPQEVGGRMGGLQAHPEGKAGPGETSVGGWSRETEGSHFGSGGSRGWQNVEKGMLPLKDGRNWQALAVWKG